MTTRKPKTAKSLEAALKVWQTEQPGKEPDLSEIFRTNRQLFLDFANSRMSVHESREKPKIAQLAKLARRTLYFTPKEKRTVVQNQFFERNVRKAKSSIGKGAMPSGKVWVFHGIPVTVKALIHHSPELGPDYKVVVRSLKQNPATKMELKQKTGISYEKLEPILKRLGAKQMIKNRSVKAKSRLFFEPHR